MGWDLDSRFTIGHGVLVKPVKTAWGIIYGQVIESLWGKRAKVNNLQEVQHLQKFTGVHTPPKHQHLNTSYTFDRTPDIPPTRLRLRANKRNNPLIPSCTPVIQQAASSYNNIALWRSPEHTGKCCLCASTGRGVTGIRGCLYSPNNTLRGFGMRGGGGWERPGPGFKEAVVHLQVSPLGLIRCERLPEGGQMLQKVITTW